VIESRISPAEAASGHSRRTERANFFLSASIRRRSDPEGEPGQVRVRNLSSQGMMADYHEAVDVGEPVIATVRGIGSVAGKVAWVRKGRIGIVFDAEIDPRQAIKPVGRPGA
jgi:hypothetical protein